MASRHGLGRGLEALIPRGGDASDGVLRLPLDRIAPNPHQPRAAFDDAEMAELSASIAAHGVLQPIIVRATPQDDYSWSPVSAGCVRPCKPA